MFFNAYEKYRFIYSFLDMQSNELRNNSEQLATKFTLQLDPVRSSENSIIKRRKRKEERTIT